MLRFKIPIIFLGTGGKIWEAQVGESDENGNRYLRRLVLVEHENQDMVRDLGCRNQYSSRVYSSHIEIK